ncbi:MAG: acyl-CoA dehydrogenase family protein [Mycobacterium sp.]
MDVGPGADQIELRENVRTVLAAECPTSVVHQALIDPQRWRALWKTVVELGWTGLSGGDFTIIDLVVVLEECGAALAPIPMLSTVGLAAGVLVRSGSFGDAVGEIESGAVAVLAAQSPRHRLPAPPMTLTDGRLRGHAVGVCDLDRADLVVTFAVDGEHTVAAVLRPGDGVLVTETASVDPTRPLADIEVDAIPETTVVVDFESVMTIPLIAAAADLVGAADGALGLAVEYAKTRIQFGKPIGGFQGIKHALADCRVAVERARGLTYAAAAAADVTDTDLDSAWRSAALAKAAASEAATRCAGVAVQVHGAIGQTWEHDCHLYTRRAWQAAALHGDARSLYHEVGHRFLTRDVA